VQVEAGFMTKSLCKKKRNWLNYFIMNIMDIEVLLNKLFYGESWSWIGEKLQYNWKRDWCK